ncbi:MAG: AAA family ATPase [Pseudomonadota bacterium]
MSIPPGQAAVAAFLECLTGAAPVETHISAIYVGADVALKMKKAVALGFLDFTALGARERFCRRELALNQPGAPALYRDVVPVTRAADGALQLGGEGEVVEWVLRMAPLPPEAFLDALPELSPALLDATADAVAALHAAAPRRDGDAPAAMERVISGNRAAGVAAGLHLTDWRPELLLYRLAPKLRARVAAGFFRRCHGDLHLGNLCLIEGRPTPFDALEFDEDLATIDTGYDLAFLLMDLEHRHGRTAANRVFNRYVGVAEDSGFFAALPLFLSLRAVIRAHVEARRGHDAGPYREAALGYLAPAPPRLVAIGGLQGSGKSHLARLIAPEIGAAPGALLLRTDEIRKRLHGVAPETRLPAEAYRPEVSAKVHETLFAQAAAALAAGHSVIADAVWYDQAMRAAVEAVARVNGAHFAGLWLEAPLPVLHARIGARRDDASDADAAVLARTAMADSGPIAWHRLDATDAGLCNTALARVTS